MCGKALPFRKTLILIIGEAVPLDYGGAASAFQIPLQKGRAFPLIERQSRIVSQTIGVAVFLFGLKKGVFTTLARTG